MKRKPKTFADVVSGQFPRNVRLFHYTSAQGLYGILEGNCIWASHCDFLNDSAEFRLLRRILPKLFRDAKYGFEELPVGWIRSRIDSAWKLYREAYEPFVFSMHVAEKSSPNFKDGSLTHWQSYGPAGYALQICPQRLSRLFAAEAKRNNLPSRFTLLSRILYVPSSATNLTADQVHDIDRLLSVGPTLLRHLKRTGRQKIALDEQLGLSLLLAAGLIKSEHYAHEEEARLVFALPFVSGRRQVPLQVRHKNSLAIPYIKVLEDSIVGRDTPIERIVIGPGAPKETEAALKLILKAKGLAAIDVHRSTISLR